MRTASASVETSLFAVNRKRPLTASSEGYVNASTHASKTVSSRAADVGVLARLVRVRHTTELTIRFGLIEAGRACQLAGSSQERNRLQAVPEADAAMNRVRSRVPKACDVDCDVSTLTIPGFTSCSEIFPDIAT